MSLVVNVLNERGNQGEKPESGCSTLLSAEESLVLSSSIQKLIKRIKGEFMMGDCIDYSALKSSPLYEEFKKQVTSLDGISLDSFTENQKKAFFINVYNTLTIHGVLEQSKLPDSVLNVQQFWRTTAYRINKFVFSLDDVEHGILRGNRSHPATRQTQFSSGDPRLKFVMENVDPRIHFALNCGAKSCPVISSYTEDNLESALESAAKLFCRQEVIVLPKNEEVIVSKLFHWYETDFGQNDIEALRWTLPYLEEEKRSQLGLLLQSIQSVGSGSIIYNEYDWSLNSVARL